MPTMPDPEEFISFRGATVDRRTAAALTVMEHRLGYELTVIKGHTATGSAVSADTHNGTSVVDLAPFDWQRKLRVAKEVGFAAYHRSPDEGPWSEHEHIILRGAGHGMDPSAQRQVDSWLRGHNGLVGDAPDRNPWRPKPLPTAFNYAAWWTRQQIDHRDDILRSRMRTWRATRKRLREQISAKRAKRAMLKAKIKHAQHALED